METVEYPKTYHIFGKDVLVSEPHMEGEHQVINITLASPSGNARDNRTVIKPILVALSAAHITTHNLLEDDKLHGLQVDVNITARLHGAAKPDFGAKDVEDSVHTALESVQRTTNRVARFASSGLPGR